MIPKVGATFHFFRLGGTESQSDAWNRCSEYGEAPGGIRIIMITVTVGDAKVARPDAPNQRRLTLAAGKVVAIEVLS